MSRYPPQNRCPADPRAAAGGPGTRDGVHLPPVTGVQGENVRHLDVDPGQLQVAARQRPAPFELNKV